MTTDDLKRLLAAEIERRIPLFEGEGAPLQDLRAAMHSLKGSAAMAGETDFALVIGQLGQRIRAQEPDAVSDAAALLHPAMLRLRQGETALASRWPEPPPGLRASNVTAQFAEGYASSMRERLAELHLLCATPTLTQERVRELFRVVHALKGMAASMGDDVTAWYCHGVELALKLALDSGQFERRLLDELLRHADLVRGLVEDGEATLDALRASTGGTRSGSRSSRLRPSAEPVMGAPLSSHAPPQSKRRPSLLTLEDAEEPGGARFAPALVDALLDQMTRIEGVVGQLENAVVALNAQAHGAQEARGALLQKAVEVAALSAWHEPTQSQWALSATTERLHALADASRTTAEQLRRQVEVLRQSARETRTRLRRLGSTTVGWLFERLEHAVEQTASRDGRLVRTDCVGEEISLPRTVAEQLLDPLQQAVRNALAHGVEPPEVRAAAGKDPVATITLRASESGDWLRIEVADDGPGVDLTKLRQLVVARGLMSTEHMLSASDQELLGQLFAPGFTTRSDSSMLAGRGVGLDLVQSSLRRLDAVARITSEMGHGFTLIFDVPLQRHAVEVLWVQAGPFELALPTVCVGRVLSQPVPNATHLGGCVGLDATGTARHQLELAIPGVVPIPVGVDGLGAVESVMVRSLPETLRRAGPFAGAVSRGDGSLRVVLDPALAGAALWAVASRRTSLTP